jgi:hypothetical protein
MSDRRDGALESQSSLSQAAGNRLLTIDTAKIAQWKEGFSQREKSAFPKVEHSARTA